MTSVLNVNNVRVASTQAHFLAPDDSFVLHELQAMAYQNDKFVKAEKCFTQADENGALNPLATRGTRGWRLGKKRNFAEGKHFCGKRVFLRQTLAFCGILVAQFSSFSSFYLLLSPRSNTPSYAH